MEQLRSLGTNIAEIVQPTAAIYGALLKKNAAQILSVKKQTFSFGPSPRQQLDVYTPPKPSVINGRHAVLIWLYGGGLVRGDRVLPGTGDLVYSNLASFFAEKFGYTVVIPDYRLVGTHAYAVFPSGGEDAGLTIQWIVDHRSEIAAEPLDLFGMGNSAGGIHLATYLLAPAFAAQRQAVFASGAPCRLRGTVFLSAPLDMANLQAYRQGMLASYYGPGGTKWPLGLLKTARENGTLDFLDADCRVFVLNAELDPWDEVQSGRDLFIKEWMLIEGDAARNALVWDTAMGHNHISPAWGLGTGIEAEEAWGFQVGAFFESQRKVGLLSRK